MGGSTSVEITWQADADSITNPGEKCVLSSPITSLSAEELFTLSEKHLRERPLNDSMYEKARELKDQPDGTLLEKCHIEVTGLAGLIAGSIVMDVYAVYKYDRENLTVTTTLYFTDATLSQVSTITRTIFHRDPFRIEVIVDDFECRRHGPILAMAASKLLSFMGYAAPCRPDAPSPSASGLKSVLSPEIEDPDLTPATFWEKMKAALEENLGAVCLPDGTVIVEEASAIRTTYFKYLKQPSGDVLVEDYQTDESMTTVESKTIYKLLDNPKCVEVWVTTRACRRSGKNTADFSANAINAIIKAAQEKAQG